MAGNGRPHKAKPRKANKARRNFRWDGKDHSITKYRANHPNKVTKAGRKRGS